MAEYKNPARISFEEALNASWVKTWPYEGVGPSGRIYFGSKSGYDQRDGVVFTLHTVSDEFAITDLNDNDTKRLFNMLFYAKDMYQLLKESNDPRAKAIIEKILNEQDVPLDEMDAANEFDEDDES